MASKFLTAEWRKLAIANYLVDPAILQSYIPYKTELDTWNGKCYVSLVGFMFLNTKLRGFSIPMHRHFEEVNLRFYVRYKDETGWKRGVTFIREIVPRHAITLIANTLYKEKYISLPMRHEWSETDLELRVKYSWRYKKRWNSFFILADPAPMEMLPGSEAEFITEHFWGYTPRTSRSCSEYQVEHPRWQIYKVKNHEIDVRFDEVYGSNFGFLNEHIPDSVMLAEGSDVSVLSMKRII